MGTHLCDWWLKARLESLALPIIFLLEGRDRAPASVILAIVGLGCIALLLKVLKTARRPRSCPEEPVGRATGGFGTLLLACLLILCSLVLHSAAVGLLGLVAIVFVPFNRFDTGFTSTIHRRLHASLAILGLAFVTTRLLILLPADAYAAPVLWLAGLTRTVLERTQASPLHEALVVGGIDIHVSHFINAWVLIPILYGFLVQTGPIGARLIRLALAMVVAFFVNALYVLSVGHLGYAALLFDTGANIFSILAGYGLALVFWQPRLARKPEEPFAPLPALALLVPVLSSCLVFLPCDAKMDKPTVAIDENHGRWETALGTFDNTAYGRDTVYNYRLLRDWLAARFPIRLITGELVDVDADILLVKMPTEYFDEEEKAFVRAFVEGGGTLFVVGDHTNLFGTSAVINDLVSWTGLRLNFDAVLPLTGPHHDLLPKWWNPVASDPGIERVEVQTGASITSTDPFVEMLLVADNVYAERADYSNDRFFGELTPSPDDRKGPFCLCARSRQGRGSVILFSDSTIWSNFSFYAITNERLFSSLIRQHGRGYWWGIAPLAFLGLWSMLLLYTWRSGSTARGLRPGKEELTLWTLSLTSVFLLLQSTGTMLLPRMAWPGSAHGQTRIVFDATNSHAELRADIRKATGSDLTDYSTFYAWLSRGGLHPLYLEEYSYRDPQVPVLILNPPYNLEPAIAQRITTFLKSGGRLLFMCDPSLQDPAIAQKFLGSYGIKMAIVRAEGSLYDAEGPDLQPDILSLPFDLLATSRAAKGDIRLSLGELRYALTGVTPLLADSSGTVVAGEKNVGKGKIVVFARSSLFSEYFFGDVWGGKETPTTKLQAYKFALELVSHATTN